MYIPLISLLAVVAIFIGGYLWGYKEGKKSE
jgi:hypothetical protein